MSVNTTGPPAVTPDEPYDPHPRHTRATHLLINGQVIPIGGDPLPTTVGSPVTYLLSEASLAQAADLATDTYDIPLMHLRTAEIISRTCTPPLLGSTLPSFSELPPVRCVAFSSSTDMQLYVLDVQSTNGHLHSHFWQIADTVWDSLHTVNTSHLLALHACLTAWINSPDTLLHVPDILHDIFLTAGNSRGGTEALLNRNLTDKTNSTSRFADPNTTTILDQCTYLLNRLFRLPTGQLPTFLISYAHMTTALIVDARMQLAHPTWILDTPPGPLSLAYTDKCHYPTYYLASELTKKGNSNHNLHFLSVEYPHVQTVDTTGSPTPRLADISAEWKTLNTGEGTLPIKSFPSLFTGLINVM